MTDYDKASGEGTLRIRDLGTTVEYWVKPYYSSFWWTNLSFTVTANGSSTNYAVDFDGNAWVKVTSRTITSSQTTTFKLNTATGTSSLGGPTTHSVFLDRATVPPVPDPVTFSLLTDDTVRGTFTTTGDGGEPIDLWYIARHTSNTLTGATSFSAGSDRTIDFSGMTPGSTYYFWSRVHNSKGWSGWSAVRSVTMLRRPFAPSKPVLSNVDMMSLNIQSTDGANGGSAITLREFAYNTVNTTTGATIVTYDGNAPVTNLPPGRTLYFWTRTRNVYGISDWSPVASTTLIAGGTITDGGVVKRGVIWYNDAGVWRPCRPWGKVAGSWNKSAT